MPAVVVGSDDLVDFVIRILTSAGVPNQHAMSVADHMAWANASGRPNYGVWRLPILCKRAEAGLFGSSDELSIDRLAPSLASIDGHNGIGHFAVTVASDLVVEMARESGTASVAVGRSNFAGAVGYYVNRIAGNGMIGFMVSNSTPRVAAHGGTAPVLGTNPLAFAAPLGDGTSVILDMATSASAGSLITKSEELGLPLPEGVAINRDGTPLTDASRVREGAMLPFGGAKGFGLGLMVEILAGVVTGSGVSHGVRSMYKDFEHPANVGHMVTALNIEMLMPLDDYYARMDGLIETMQDSGDVRIPGQARWEAVRHAEEVGGAELDSETTAALEDLADRLEVEVPWQRSDLQEGNTSQ
jgi:LDH2 family malate/lactate/ureidoglycolate dehydrogenase